MDIIAAIAEELQIKKGQAEAAVKLIDEGNTIPFIARYRKEATGSLNDEVLRNLFDRLTYLRNLEDKKQTVLASIEEQGKLTDELKKAILEAQTQVAVDDLYRPYRPKRRTRATIAKEKGLEPLAQTILAQESSVDIMAEAAKYVDAEKDVADEAAALAGAKDIIAENVSDNAGYRTKIRELTMQKGRLISTAKDPKAESVYEMYYEFDEALSKVAGHRTLAINRGEKEKILTVKIEAPTEDIIKYLKKQVITNDGASTAAVLTEVVEDAYDRLIAPAIEREIRNNLTEEAEDGAIKVFGKNLEQLLMQPPIAGQVVLGWDPAFRTGCKISVVDPTGKVLDTTVIYPTAPQNKVEEAKTVIKKLIDKHHVTLISLGNGTASRESEQVIVELLKEIPVKVQYIIVNEAGASVYSASKLATEEFPNFDVGQRSATSMARRPGRGAALSGTSAGSRRPALCLPPVDGVRLRGCGACLSADHPHRQGGGGCRQHGGSAGGASAACGRGHSGGHQPQIQQRPRRHQRSHCGCTGRAHRAPSRASCKTSTLTVRMRW